MASDFSGADSLTSFDRAASHPNPAYDFLTGFAPRKLKDLFRWSEYLMYNSAHIYAALRKFGELVVTDIEYGTASDALRRRYKHLYTKTLKIKGALLRASLDKHVYGNHFSSIYQPFVRHLKCPSCETLVNINNVDYKFELKKLAFNYHCKKCRKPVSGKVVDRKLMAAGKIHIIRWDPKQIDIEYNPITGQSIYYYNIPQEIKDKVKAGAKHLINSTPMEFLENIRDSKLFKFDKDAIFHSKVASPSGIDQQWGFPPLASTLKLFLYTMILRKANECVSLQTPIETATGLVAADQVKVGDLVRTHMGRWRRVEQKWYRDAREDEVGRRIVLSGLRSLSGIFSPHHPILTLRRTRENLRSDTKERQTSSVMMRNPHLYEEVMCPAEQFQVGDYTLYPRTIPSSPQVIDVAKYTGFAATDNFVYSGTSQETADAFEVEEVGSFQPTSNSRKTARRILADNKTPKRMGATRPLTADLAYILGWYVGGGSVGARHVVFSTGADPEPKLRAAILREFGVECGAYNQTGNCHMLTLCDVIVRTLIKGMVPGAAREKRVPVEVFHAPDDVKLAFLRGLWEADGYRREGQETLSTSSEGLAYDVYRISLHLGCIATISQHETPPSTLKTGRVIQGGDHYHVIVSGESQRRLQALWECGKGPEIVIGKSGFFWKDFFAARVHAIEEVEEEQFIDFRVDEDSTFCVAGVATHNSIALEHIVPMRILHPVQQGGQDITQMISFSRWQGEMKENIRRWRRDPLHVMFAPVPLGVASMGGDGRAMLTLGELQEAEKSIMAALGIPQEFLYGGLTKAGMEATLRLIENQTQNDADDMNDLLQWYTDKISKSLSWETIDTTLAPLKMVDDTETKQTIIGLATGQTGAPVVSLTTMAERLGLDLDKERDKRMQEALDEAVFQQKLQTAMQKMQNTLAQQVQQQIQGTQGLNYDQQAVIAQADTLVQQLMGLDPNTRRSQMHSLQVEDAVMYAVVVQRLEEQQNQQTAQAKAQIAGQPPM